VFNQLNKRIKEFIWSKFRGIDRSVSANDANPESAQILRDLVITPEGKLKRRDEFAALYEDRPSQFEHTTNDDSRTVNSPSTGHTVSRTHAAKSICVGKSGTSPVEYVFTGWAEIETTADTVTLWLVRGVRSGLDIAWNDHATGVPPPEKLQIVQVATDAGHTDGWIEFSMVMDAAKTAIYVAAIHRATGGNPIVSLYTITNIYVADFATATVTATIASIATSVDIGRHVDIEIGNDDNLMICWWRFYDNVNPALAQYKIDYCYGLAGTMGAPATYDNGKGLGYDMMGFSLVRDPSITATNDFYLSFLENQAGGLYKVYYQKFVAGAVSGSASQVTATAYSEGTQYQIAVVSSIDIDGTKHWLWRNTATGLTHTWEDNVPAP